MGQTMVEEGILDDYLSWYWDDKAMQVLIDGNEEDYQELDIVVNGIIYSEPYGYN